MEMKESLTTVLTKLLDLAPKQERIVSDYLYTNSMTGLLNNFRAQDLGEEVNQKLEALKILTDILGEVKNG